MTIREMEKLSGMSRANIRYYEAEGLLCPSRDANGYRNYSEEDLKTLQRIRLLRKLHLGLEEIRAVSRGEKKLSLVLARHISQLREEEEDDSRCLALCRRLWAEQADYASLDAAAELERLKEPQAPGGAEPGETSLPRVTAPWRRYFARCLDWALYGLIWELFLSAGLHINVGALSVGLFLADWLARIVLLLVLEPLFLISFGATPGKLVFGLRVAGKCGIRISWREARLRTRLVLRWGCGFYIPVYVLVRQWRAYKACENEERQEWEDESLLRLKDTRTAVRAAVYTAAAVCCAAASFFVWQAGALPVNRGALSAAEFCENYNRLQDYYGISRPVNVPDTPLYNYISFPMTLDEEGRWQFPPGRYQDFAENFSALPELQFEGDRENITGVRFSLSYRNEDVTVTSYGDFMALASLAFLGAQEDYCLFSDPPLKLWYQIRERASGYGDFSVMTAGVLVKCRVDYSGYERTEGGAMLSPAFGQTPFYELEFSIRKMN
mgnify:CR=1 FL=1